MQGLPSSHVLLESLHLETGRRSTNVVLILSAQSRANFPQDLTPGLVGPPTAPGSPAQLPPAPAASSKTPEHGPQPTLSKTAELRDVLQLLKIILDTINNLFLSRDGGTMAFEPRAASRQPQNHSGTAGKLHKRQRDDAGPRPPDDLGPYQQQKEGLRGSQKHTLHLESTQDLPDISPGRSAASPPALPCPTHLLLLNHV